MSAMICGKRSFFDELQSPSQSPPSISKKLRCSSTSPPPPPPPPPYDVIDQLRALFPDIDSQFLEKALEECGNDLDAAIKRLHELRRGCAEGKSVSATEADGEMTSGKEPDMHAKFSGTEPTASAINNRPEWVELIVREMMSATSIDDVRARAARVLEGLEKSINTGAIVEAAQNFHKENMMLKEHIEMILRDNAILKRAVAIQHERQKEYDDRNQEVQQLKQMIVQYQEHLRNLEVNNYALKMHLRQAQQGNSIPGRFHPDVF